ncbi:MAG: hypothetical protein ACLFRY_11830 [Spirochaetia bacterium]
MARKTAPRGVALACIILFACLPAIGWGDIYRSNELGIAFESISPIRTDEFPYYLEIIREEDRESRVLYHEGEPVKRWVRTRLETGGTEVVEYREGEVVESTLYDRRERVSEIRTYEDGSLAGRLVYSYTDGRISSVIRYDERGNLLEGRTYRHDSKGRLLGYREISSTGPAIARSRYLYSDGTIREEWHGNETRGDMFRYNDAGKLVFHEGWLDGDVVFRLIRTYSEEGLPLSSREVDFEAETVTVTHYDEGRIVRELTETMEGTRIEEITYSYGPGGNLAEKYRKAREIRESWEYSYDGDELARSAYRRRGEIVRVTEYQNEDDYVETVYRNGQPLIEIEYEDGKKVGEARVR